MTSIGTQSGAPRGRTAIVANPDRSERGADQEGRSRKCPVRLASHPVTRLLTSIPKTVAIGTSPDTVAVVR